MALACFAFVCALDFDLAETALVTFRVRYAATHHLQLLRRVFTFIREIPKQETGNKRWHVVQHAPPLRNMFFAVTSCRGMTTTFFVQHDGHNGF